MDIKSKLLESNFFIDNKYLNKYIELIESRRSQKKIKYKTAKHHIIPRFISKYLGEAVDNSKDNLVNLYHWEHLLAHFYLSKACKDSEALLASRCALIFIYGKYDFQSIDEESFLYYAEDMQNYIEESYMIAATNASSKYMNKSESEKLTIRAKRKKSISELVTLHNNEEEIRVHKNLVDTYISKGYILGRSDKSREADSKSKKGFEPWNKGMKNPVQIKDSTRQKLALASLGHEVSSETRAKISEKNKGKIYISKGDISKKVYPEELQVYLEAGWVKGSVVNKQSHLNKCVINNGQTTITIKIDDIDSYLAEGWQRGYHRSSRNKGRCSPTKGRIRITDGTRSKFILECDLCKYPGWKRYKNE